MHLDVVLVREEREGETDQISSSPRESYHNLFSAIKAFCLYSHYRTYPVVIYPNIVLPTLEIMSSFMTAIHLSFILQIIMKDFQNVLINELGLGEPNYHRSQGLKNI